jgi:hypothetical protein
MTLTLWFFSTIVACLLGLLAWAIGKPRNRKRPIDGPASLEQVGRRHTTYLPLIRQALSRTDFVYLVTHGSRELAVRVRAERRRVVLSYLANLRDDHLRLVRVAKVVAVLSPEVASAQELERAWLTVQFMSRYQILRVEVYAGLLSLRSLDALSHMVSDLAVRVETAMNELGERAMLAAKLTSSLERGGVDVG